MKRIAMAALLALPGCFAGAREQERDVDAARQRVDPLPGDAVDAILRAPPLAPEIDAVISNAPTLHIVEDAAVRRNPSLEAALERWVAFLERVPQRSAPPAPMLEYRYSSMFKMNEVGASMALPFPGKLVSEARAALAEAAAAGADFQASENALRAQAAIAYASLFLARRELAIVDENLVLLDRFVEVARSKYKAGAASLPDVLRVETERENLRADRDSARASVDVATSALDVLLDRHPDAPIGPLAPLEAGADPPELAALYDRALERRPELRAARERVSSSEHMVARAEQEWVPDLSFGAMYVRDFGTDHNWVEATGGISIPWIFAPAIAAKTREAEAEARRARADTRAARNAVLDEVKTAPARTSAAAARFRRLDGEVIPRARKNVDASEAAYVAGQLDFLALIDAQRSLLAAQRARENALAELAMRRAELVKAVGGSFEER